MDKRRSRRRKFRARISELTRKGQRFCASALCVSLVLGNVGNVAGIPNALAADVLTATGSNALEAGKATPSDASVLREFELNREDLIGAMQDAIVSQKGETVDLDFLGAASDEYAEFLENGGYFYELTPELEENTEKFGLRIFVNVDEASEIPLMDDVSQTEEADIDQYRFDGTEQFLFLLTNNSDQEQKADIYVEDRHTGEITVAARKADQPAPRASVETGPAVVLLATSSDAQNVGPGVEQASPSDAESGETAETPEATPSDAEENLLNGTLGEAVYAVGGTVVGYMTTSEDLDLAVDVFQAEVEGSEDILVEVTAKRGVIGDGEELIARMLNPGDADGKYEEAEANLAGVDYSGMVAMDIGFWRADGTEVVLPEGSDVQVEIKMNADLLPEEADVSTLTVQHHAKTETGIRLDTVATSVAVAPENTEEAPETEAEAENADIVSEEPMAMPMMMAAAAIPEVEEETDYAAEDLLAQAKAAPGTVDVIRGESEEAVVATAFTVDGFSTFTITYRSGRTEKSVNIRYADNKTKSEIYITKSSKLPSFAVANKIYNISDFISPDKNWQYVDSWLDYSDSKNRVQGIQRIRYNSRKGCWQYSRSLGGNDWTDNPYNKDNNGTDKGTVWMFYENSRLEKPTAIETVNSKDLGITINAYNYTGGELNEGINNGHTLKFTNGGNNNNKNDTDNINEWGGNGDGTKPYIQGILANKLVNGYPVLSGKHGGQSLEYLFNATNYDGKKTAYMDLNHLFRLDEYEKNGYFEYDSTENFAKLNIDPKSEDYENFTVYADDTTDDAKFMPFNDMYKDRVLKGTKDFHFGMNISFEFIQPKDGKLAVEKISETGEKTTELEDMVFEFNGDDDLWVFVDGVLVLDIGGIHDAAGGTINFNTGRVEVKGKLQKSIGAALKEAGVSDDQLFKDEKKGIYTLADYSEHSVQIYYFERGEGKSNCKFRFNIPPIPTDSITFLKKVGYTNVNDVSNLDFDFDVYVDYDPEDQVGFEPYYGEYKIIDENGSERTGVTSSENPKITLKDLQRATLVNDKITVFSKFYIREIGATSDKYKVTSKETEFTIIGKDGKPIGSGSSVDDQYGVQTDEHYVKDVNYVRFTNDVVAENQFNLRIEKKLPQDIRSNDSYKVKVFLGENDPITYIGKYTYHDRETGRTEILTTDNEGVITLQAGDYAEIKSLVGGNTVTVVEVDLNDSDYWTPIYSMTGDALNGEPVMNGTGKGGITGTAKEGNALPETPVITATILNTPKPELHITKQVEGTGADEEKLFDFTIKVKNENSSRDYSVAGTYDVIENGEVTRNKVTIDENGNFKLKHGQTLVIPKNGLPQNAKIEVSEILSDGYTAECQITPAGNLDTAQGSAATIGKLDKSKEIIFTNRKMIVPPTGIFDNNMPYLLMLVIALLSLTGFTFSLKELKKSRDDD